MAKREKPADNGDNDVPTPPAEPTPAAPTPPAKDSGTHQIPTRGRVVDFVTDEKVLVSAIVSSVYGAGDQIQMHLAALDPRFGNRNYHIADVHAAYRPTLGTLGLKTREELDQEAESLEPGTWSWPQRH